MLKMPEKREEVGVSAIFSPLARAKKAPVAAAGFNGKFGHLTVGKNLVDGFWELQNRELTSGFKITPSLAALSFLISSTALIAPYL